MLKTPAEFEKEMAELKEKYGYDEEAVHDEMDKLMCEVLISLGYEKGVEIFDSTNKWYV